MKALILAGGKGKRLKPLTDNIPKPLIPINNIPIIEWQIRYFKKFGINDFVICAGYKSEQVVDYLSTKLDANFEYSLEKNLLGTGGAIKNAKSFLGKDNFFVINGDVVTNLDLSQLQKIPNSIAAIQLRSTKGILNLDGNMIKGFMEKPIIQDYWINAGVYNLTSDIIEQLPEIGNIEDTTFPLLANEGNLSCVKYSDIFWHSIDSHKDIEECSKEMLSINYEKFLDSN